MHGKSDIAAGAVVDWLSFSGCGLKAANITGVENYTFKHAKHVKLLPELHF